MYSWRENTLTHLGAAIGKPVMQLITHFGQCMTFLTLKKVSNVNLTIILKYSPVWLHNDPHVSNLDRTRCLAGCEESFVP
jgi:hypothetical protein